MHRDCRTFLLPGSRARVGGELARAGAWWRGRGGAWRGRRRRCGGRDGCDDRLDRRGGRRRALLRRVRLGALSRPAALRSTPLAPWALAVGLALTRAPPRGLLPRPRRPALGVLGGRPLRALGAHRPVWGRQCGRRARPAPSAARNDQEHGGEQDGQPSHVCPSHTTPERRGAVRSPPVHASAKPPEASVRPGYPRLGRPGARC